MAPSRRTVLRWGAGAGATVVVPAAGLAGYVWSNAYHSNVESVRFDKRLAIPPVAETHRDEKGRVTFDFRVQEGTTELLPGKETATWGVNGSYLGPTLRLGRGQTVAPAVHNELPETTTMHWHGMELPPDCDGGPHQPIEPGQIWRPSWKIDQPAATLWYHPHPHGQTKEHVYRGVSGMLLVDDDEAKGLLPQEYGVDDIPVIVQDKNFTDDGQLDLDGISFAGTDIIGLLGSEILVNGTWGPVLPVTTERVRLRVLNASNARIYDFVFDDERPFHIVASDSGLLPAPVEATHVQLSPGERVEIILGVRPDERLLLRSAPPDLGGNVIYERLAGGDDVFDVLEIRAARQLRPSRPFPRSLPAPPRQKQPEPGREERTFVLGDFFINGKTMKMSRVDEFVPLGSTEDWRIRNGAGIPHNFHIHNAGFDILDIDGEQPPEWLRGRKDTVYMRPGNEVRVRVGFGQYTDTGERDPYMYHCHLLAHEDAGMMGQFTMVTSESDIPDGNGDGDADTNATPPNTTGREGGTQRDHHH